MKATPNRPILHPLNAPADPNAKYAERATPPKQRADPVIVDGEPTRDFLDLFRSRWNCAILHVLRPRLAQAPPQLRRHQLDKQLPGALEKSVSNALDTLVGAGLVRARPARDWARHALLANARRRKDAADATPDRRGLRRLQIAVAPRT